MALLVLLAFAGCSRKETPLPAASAPAQVLRLSQRNEPGDLDPGTIAIPDDLFVIRALSEGLVTPAPGGGQRAAAAERWEVSADGLTYTFHLRPGARWSNGEAVTAQDFIDSYHRALTPATAGPKVDVFFSVKNAGEFFAGRITDFAAVGFRAPGSLVLVVTLEEPNPAFLAYAASGPWIPVNPRVVAQYGRNWTRPGQHVGNGPFTLVEWKPHQRIVVRKNPLYLDAARVALSEIQFLSYDNGDAEDRAYRAGQIDATMAVPNSKIEPYARERPTEFHRLPLAETRYLSFNTGHAPLNDARVRRALSLLIDRERITSRVTFSGTPASSFLPPTLFPPGWPARSAAGPAPGAAPVADEARQLLADAGFKGGAGFPRLELSCWSSSQTSTLEAIQARWKTELGIDVGLITREAKVHLASLREKTYDIGFVTAIPDAADPLSLLANLTSDSADNYPQWSNAHYDELVAKASRSRDMKSQALLVAEAEAVLAAEVPVAPVYYNMKNWLMSPRLVGWQEDALWTRFYVGVSLSPK